ncbi:MAG: N-acetyltransferase [Proteobacteria bacterium]|nr:N-acetyltransferase [Pseudomonadota bacterium]
METPAIVHNAAAQRFEARIDGQLAHCDYRMDGATMKIVHTEVPPAYEGQGIAHALVEAAIAHARAQHYKVLPLCSYVRAYAARHPELADLIVSR